MKNLVIAILSAWIISGFSFWEYDIPEDQWWIALIITLVIFVTVESFDGWLKDRRRKRIMRKRYMDDAKQNRPR